MRQKNHLCNYYVDEAGDPTLFDKKGKVLLGSEGCSKFFVLGLLQVNDPASLEAEFSALRNSLLADPYFAGVPSMQPKMNKTFLAFHAKDDLPEVRREVFSLLMKRTDLRFFGIVRDKEKLLSYVRYRNSIDPEYRYQPNELYDYLVRRLFRDRLHTHDSYRIFFARRGSSDRTHALKLALLAAQNRFTEKYRQPPIHPPFELLPAYSKDIAALQAADYFLWSLQRLFERGEDRYLALLWPSFRLVNDIDDIRAPRYGAFYNQKYPLNAITLQGRA